MDDDQVIVVEVENCSSCGGEHFVVMVPLELPVEEDGIVFTHVTVCPKTGDELYAMLASGTQYLN